MLSPVVWTHTLDYKNHVQAKLGQDLGAHVLIWSWKPATLYQKETNGGGGGGGGGDLIHNIFVFDVLGYVLLVWVPVILFSKIIIPN
jgi:hypothetical protein